MAEGTVTIGRIGVPSSRGGDNATFLEPNEITQTANGLTLSGIQQESTVARTQWVRDQLLGLIDPGTEPIIPITFTSFPLLDGFYRLNNVTADRAPSVINWSVDLTRIQGWGAPRVEIVTPYSLTPNSHGVTGGDMVLMPPGTPSSWPGTANWTARPNADGYTMPGTYAITGLFSGTARTVMQVKPSEWYKGGCRAELNLASLGTYYTVVGRRSFADPVDLARFRMSNGLVRITGPGATLNPQWWDGTAWRSVQNFAISDVNWGAVSTGSGGFSILRNAPEEVCVRIIGSVPLGTSLYPVWIDLSIRRGSRVLVCYVYSLGATQWRISEGSAPAQTAITGGLRDTSNAADGHRYLLVSNNATNIDTANKRISQTSTTPGTILFGMSIEIGGSAATVGDGYIAQANEFFASGSDTTIITSI